MEKNLTRERERLVANEYNTYSPDNFPGSAAWQKNRTAQQALNAFDLSHPEIVAAIRSRAAAKKAAEKLYWQSDEGREKMRGM